MKPIVLVLITAICCTLGSLTLEAAPDEEAIIRAKSHYESGTTAYKLGKFDEATDSFSKAYEESKMSDFLYNIAQSHRMAGKCMEALFDYESYLSAKVEDKEALLGKEELTEIARSVYELTTCIAKPLHDPPPPVQSGSSYHKPPPPAPPGGASTREQRSPQGDGRLFADATVGNAVFLLPQQPITYEPSFSVAAGYLLPGDRLTPDAGVRVSYSSFAGTLVGIRATVGATYRVSGKLNVRGEAEIGIAVADHELRNDAYQLDPLMRPIPLFTVESRSLMRPMLSFAVGVAVEYAITPNLHAIVKPLGPAFIQEPSGWLTQLDVLLGLGYRM